MGCEAAAVQRVFYVRPRVPKADICDPSISNTSLFEGQGERVGGERRPLDDSFGLLACSLSRRGDFRLAGGRVKDALRARLRGRAPPVPDPLARSRGMAARRESAAGAGCPLAGVIG
jgi:hypothetical protein